MQLSGIATGPSPDLPQKTLADFKKENQNRFLVLNMKKTIADFKRENHYRFLLLNMKTLLADLKRKTNVAFFSRTKAFTTCTVPLSPTHISQGKDQQGSPRAPTFTKKKEYLKQSK